MFCFESHHPFTKKTPQLMVNHWCGFIPYWTILNHVFSFSSRFFNFWTVDEPAGICCFIKWPTACYIYKHPSWVFPLFSICFHGSLDWFKDSFYTGNHGFYFPIKYGGFLWFFPSTNPMNGFSNDRARQSAQARKLWIWLDMRSVEVWSTCSVPLGMVSTVFFPYIAIENGDL